MAKPPTGVQIDLAVDAWRLTDRHAWLLAELDVLHKEAITLAATYGVPQKSLPALCDVSGPRISKIVSTTDVPSVPLDTFHESVTELLERRPNPAPQDGAVDQAAWNRKFAISRGRTPSAPGTA